MRPEFDDVDKGILIVCESNRITLQNPLGGGKPLVGDFVIMPNGDTKRFAYAWDDGIQVTWKDDGSFYLCHNGSASMSGSLDPSIPYEQLEKTKEFREGQFWFFHHNISGAHRGVYFKIRCPVWRVKTDNITVHGATMVAGKDF